MEYDKFGDEVELLFNFDLKMQEKMMERISQANYALMLDVPHKAFKVMNALYLLLHGGLDEKQRENHEKFKVNIESKADMFEIMLDNNSIEFNGEKEKFMFDEIIPIQRRMFPPNFRELRKDIDKQLEEWMKAINIDMVKIGLIFKKGEDPMYALKRGRR